MNKQLAESLLQAIFSLTFEEQEFIREKFFYSLTEPSTIELMQLAQVANTFNFLQTEPDLYTLIDG